MKKILLVCCMLSMHFGYAQQVISNTDRDVVFVGVNVVSMDAPQVLENQTVVTRNGKIVSIIKGSSNKHGKDALVVQAKGKYLMPGLAEMHGHVPQTEDLKPMEEVLMLNLVHGITNVRGMLGVPKHLELRDKIKAGEILAPHFTTSGPSFNGHSVNTPEKGVQMVQAQKQAGYDVLKLHPGLTKATFPGIAKTAKQVGIPFAGHVSFNVGIWMAIDAEYSTIDHLDGFIEGITPGIDTMTVQEAGIFATNIAHRADRSKIPNLVKGLREKNIYVVPTMALGVRWLGVEPMSAYENDPDLRYIDKAEAERWLKVRRDFLTDKAFDRKKIQAFLDLRNEILKACQQGGVKLLLGCDAPQILNVPGFATHHELKYLVDAGLTPFEALASGTTNVALYFGKENTSGKVKTGFDSDLVLLSANPLENIENTKKVEAVMIGDKYLDKQFIQSQLNRLRKW